jgi:hypothetical protein
MRKLGNERIGKLANGEGLRGSKGIGKKRKIALR